jgi:hypothetical protein
MTRRTATAYASAAQRAPLARTGFNEVMEALTGIGLAASAGLNAYIPLLILGLLNRFTDLIHLPGGWQWLSNGWMITGLGVLLAVEVVADKVPALDSVNDVVQTGIRPTAGGLAFGASSQSQTVTVSDPGTFFHGHQWIGIVTGAAIALVLHLMKAGARPVINTVTLGFGAPVVSTIEDAASISMSFVAILLPILVIVCLVIVVFGLWRLRERIKRRRAARAAQSSALGPPSPITPDR